VTLYGIVRFQRGACQEIRANHLQRIASGFVGPEHESRDFKRTLDHGQLALVQLKIDDLPRLRFLAGQVAIHFPSKLFFRKLLRFVHPGCTVEFGSIATRHLYQFSCLRPPHFSKLMLRYSREMLVNRERLQVFDVSQIPQWEAIAQLGGLI